jgi:hypothetical protein
VHYPHEALYEFANHVVSAPVTYTAGSGAGYTAAGGYTGGTVVSGGGRTISMAQSNYVAPGGYNSGSLIRASGTGLASSGSGGYYVQSGSQMKQSYSTNQPDYY